MFLSLTGFLSLSPGYFRERGHSEREGGEIDELLPDHLQGDLVKGHETAVIGRRLPLLPQFAAVDEDVKVDFAAALFIVAVDDQFSLEQRLDRLV
jgi:hypothetical protein